MKKFLFGSLFFLVGCASLDAKGPSGPYGPKGEQDVRKGVVRYNPNGLPDLVKVRKEEAYKKIWNYCGQSNDYRVVKEGLSKKKHGGLATMAAGSVYEIHFECNDITSEETP